MKDLQNVTLDLGDGWTVSLSQNCPALGLPVRGQCSVALLSPDKEFALVEEWLNAEGFSKFLAKARRLKRKAEREEQGLYDKADQKWYGMTRS